MAYIMQDGLRAHIVAQRKEAEEFSKQPGCWMGSYPDPDDSVYWSQRVPTGTLREFMRITLEEDAYYTLAEAYSKSYARAHDFSTMTEVEINELIESASRSIQYDIEREKQEEAEEEAHLEKLASSLEIDRETLDRWLEAA